MSVCSDFDFCFWSGAIVRESVHPSALYANTWGTKTAFYSIYHYMVERARYINKPDNSMLAGNVLCMFFAVADVIAILSCYSFGLDHKHTFRDEFHPTDPIHKLTFRPTDWKNIFWIWHSSLYIEMKTMKKKNETMLILLTPWTWQPSCFLCSFSFRSCFSLWKMNFSYFT